MARESYHARRPRSLTPRVPGALPCRRKVAARQAALLEVLLVVLLGLVKAGLAGMIWVTMGRRNRFSASRRQAKPWWPMAEPCECVKITDRYCGSPTPRFAVVGSAGLPEHAQELIVANERGIERHLDRLGVPGAADPSTPVRTSEQACDRPRTRPGSKRPPGSVERRLNAPGTWCPNVAFSTLRATARTSISLFRLLHRLRSRRRWLRCAFFLSELPGASRRPGHSAL